MSKNFVTVDPTIWELRPDYALFVIGAKNVTNAPSDEESRKWLAAAAATVADARTDPRIEAWREAYRAMGVKPQKFRPSADALIRRAESGLPEINKVVDAYNAVSVRHRLPVGGEDASAYVGNARLTRADGSEKFETVSGGDSVIEVVEPGEVIWRDDEGVTCRRWSWRQCSRTRLEVETTEMVFFLERLEPMSIDELVQAGDELSAFIKKISPDSTLSIEVIKPPA